MDTTVTYKGKEYSRRHGGPFDRGAADSWYRRGMTPHYYVEGTGTSPRVAENDMSAEEIAEYVAGYLFNESCGGHKEW